MTTPTVDAIARVLVDQDHELTRLRAIVARVREEATTLDAMASGADACGNLPGYLAFRAAAKRVRAAVDGDQ